MNVESMTIDGLVRRMAINAPAKRAVVSAQVSLTYEELDREVRRLALGLIEVGLEKGDRVAILFLNDPNFLICYFAVLRCGGVVVPLNTRLVADEVAYQISHSDSRLILHGDEFDDMLDSVGSRPPWSRRVSPTGRADGAMTLAQVARLGDDVAEPVFPSVHHDDAAGIWYTSGTTGTPKGAIVTHASSLWSAIGMALTGGVTARSRLLAPAPLFHRGPMETLSLAGFLVGATHFLLPKFDPADLLDSIERHAITHAFIVPSMTFAVLNLPQRGDYDLTSVTCWLTASASFPEEYRDRLEAETTLRSGMIINAYGITESLLNACFDPASLEGHRGSVGSAVPGTLIRVLDSHRAPMPAGEIGEIAVSGASIAAGYIDNDEAWNAVTFVEDGLTWYLSGDLGYLDDDGFLYIVDRVKDMVISGGENVYSAEVERVLVTHPDIAEVAIIGTPDQRWGECVTAVISSRAGAILDVEALEEYCAGRLAAYKRPRRVFHIEELPRNAFGKVRKGEVRDFVRARLVADAGQPGAGPAVPGSTR
ncbi:long-chain fatty acid--CoA ligase [Nocardioides endophyticus]|uniref:Long-chain fatty acid--CoA ligase n=1 Tax=Nocardioides endophyticus TaxID=1353775 RepID=A0ABP8ZDB8_9ACTN